MHVINGVEALHVRLSGMGTVAFVPTMGNLHEGHLDLVRQARAHADCVVVSIFVNPLQFGPNEDFDKYPRTLAEDCTKLEGLADVVFAPTVSEMYPQRQSVFVAPPPIAEELCGAARPGHFRGMATVVLKLLNIVQTQVALFGKKDYQQLHIIREMVAQLNLPIRIIGGETVRAADGLALSSRNQYLTATERSEATFLRQVLSNVAQDVVRGVRAYPDIEAGAVAALAERGWQVDYVTVRERATLTLPQPADKSFVVLAAARLGATRLIDNLEVDIA